MLNLSMIYAGDEHKFVKGPWGVDQGNRLKEAASGGKGTGVPLTPLMLAAGAIAIS